MGRNGLCDLISMKFGLIASQGAFCEHQHFPSVVNRRIIRSITVWCLSPDDSCLCRRKFRTIGRYCNAVLHDSLNRNRAAGSSSFDTKFNRLCPGYHPLKHRSPYVQCKTILLRKLTSKAPPYADYRISMSSHHIIRKPILFELR